MQRDTARLRRTDAIRSYLDAPRAERSKQAAAAEKRVASGKASERDKLIVETHQRRTKNDAGRSRSAVSKANAAHDRQAAANEARKAVLGLVEQLGEKRFQVSKDSGRSVLDSVTAGPAGLVAEGAKNLGKAAKAATDVTADSVGNIAKALQGASSGSVPGTRGQQMRAGIGADAPKALLLPVSVTANVAKVAADDPAQVPRAVKDTVNMVEDIVPSLIAAAKDPKGAGKAVLEDYGRRYGALLRGNDEEFRERLRKEGIAPEVLDLTGAFSAGSGTTTRVIGAAAKGTAKRLDNQQVIGRVAAKVDRGINAPRPKLRIAPGKAVEQHKASGVLGLALQRGHDKVRQKRVTRELAQAADRERSIELPENATRKERRSADRREDPTYGHGVRGLMPEEGEVVSVTAGRRFDRQAKAQRKQVARVSSTGFRRLNRQKLQFTKVAERQFQRLGFPEQRAAVAALEGLVNANNAEASLRSVRREIKAIETYRAKQRSTLSEQEYFDKIGRHVNRPTDDLVTLRRLAQDLERDPESVLTPGLRKFVATQRDVRPHFERIAQDSVDPATMLARRYAPAGERLGTRSAYEAERTALELVADHGGVPAARSALDRQLADAAAASSVLGAGKLADLRRARGALERVATDVSSGDLDAARLAAAQRFAERTRRRGEKAGLDLSDPIYVLHRNADTGGAGAFTAGDPSKGAVRASKRSDMELLRRGTRDLSDRAFAQGVQQTLKRSTQWRMINDLIQDLVPAWGKNDGKGFTWAEYRAVTDRQKKQGVILDPQDWVVWRPGREQVGWKDRPVGEGEVTLDVNGDPSVGVFDPLPGQPARPGDPAPPIPQWATTERFFVVPRSAMREMQREGGRLTSVLRGAQRYHSLQSQGILGLNPTYGLRQAAGQMPIAILQVGGQWFTPGFYRSLAQYRRIRKSQPEVWAEITDTLGFQSKSADAIRAPRKGGLSENVRRQEGALERTWPIIFGGAPAKDYVVANRKSRGAKGDVSVAARTALQSNPVSLQFRLTRDFNRMIDDWQDALSRTIVLAATDSRMRKADAREFARDVSGKVGDLARKVGPVAASMSLPPDEFAKLARTAEYRHMLEDVGDTTVRFLGDFANFTQAEMKIGRALVPFFGFVRYSTKLLLHTMPMRHPVQLAALLQLASIGQQEKERLLTGYMKANGFVGKIPDMLPGLLVLSDGQGDLDVANVNFINPLTGPMLGLIEKVSSGQSPLGALQGLMAPITQATVEGAAGVDLFSGGALTNAKGQVNRDDNPLGTGGTVRLGLNTLGNSVWPYRAADILLNKDRGRLSSTSLPWDPEPLRHKPGGIADQRDQKRIEQAKKRSTISELAASVVPGMPSEKTRDSLLNAAEYEAQKQAKAAARRSGPRRSRAKKTGSPFGGGGGFGGSSSGFGGSGGAF